MPYISVCPQVRYRSVLRNSLKGGARWILLTGIRYFVNLLGYKGRTTLTKIDRATSFSGARVLSKLYVNPRSDGANRARVGSSG